MRTALCRMQVISFPRRHRKHLPARFLISTPGPIDAARVTYFSHSRSKTRQETRHLAILDHMKNHPGIKALVFDVFGTIVDWSSGIAREAEPFLNRYAPGLDTFDFADAWRREYSPSMEEVRSGRRPYVRLDILHRENLVRVLTHYGIVG